MKTKTKNALNTQKWFPTCEPAAVRWIQWSSKC